MKAIIIAAGEGRRFQDVGAVKPLTPLNGIQLIRRVLSLISEAGATEIGIVTGYRAETLEQELSSESQSLPVHLHFIRNENWRHGNGTSVLAAEQFAGEPFILLMSDHLFDSSIVNDLRAQPLAKDGVILAVDRNLSNPLIDLDDVTRVLCQDNRIQVIGKHIEGYNAFDTGIFYVSPTLFRALAVAKEKSLSEGKSFGLSDGMQVMADWGKAEVFDIGSRFWIDVDDREMFEKAQKILSEQNQSGAGMRGRRLASG